jgi:UDP-GlcNAc:undecaprenyl-phosphate GlcNAc-1-phosphate transferase
MATDAVSIGLLFISSALTSFVTTGIVRRAAERVGLVDEPNERKVHRTATPRLGGLAIIFGFGFPLLLLAATDQAAHLVTKNLAYLFAVLASGALIVGLGVYDDLIGANAPKKFLVQTAAAIVLVMFGFQFDDISLAGRVFDLGFFGPVASVLWIVGVINAMNLIDGLDTLATLVGITVAVAFGVIAVLRSDLFSLVIMTSLAGSLIGFFPWNRPPAKIFMGDTGSLFIGLLLAACSIAKPSKSPTALLVSGPVLALALPVLDTLLVMHARLGAGDSLAERFTRLFRADRKHIHHILAERYGSVVKVIFRVWLLTVLFAAAAVMTTLNQTRWWGYGLGAVALLTMLFFRYRPAKARS